MRSKLLIPITGLISTMALAQLPPPGFNGAGEKPLQGPVQISPGINATGNKTEVRQTYTQPTFAGGQSINPGNILPSGEIQSQVDANIEHRAEERQQEHSGLPRKDAYASTSSMQNNLSSADQLGATLPSTQMQRSQVQEKIADAKEQASNKKAHASEMAAGIQSVLGSTGSSPSIISGLVVRPPLPNEDVSQAPAISKEQAPTTLKALPERKSK